MLSKPIGFDEPISIDKAIKNCYVDLKPAARSKINGIIFLSRIFEKTDNELKKLNIDVYFALEFKYLHNNKFKMLFGIILR